MTGSGIDRFLLTCNLSPPSEHDGHGQQLMFTCGNKLEYKKSASMTTWAMISSDPPHRGEASRRELDPGVLDPHSLPGGLPGDGALLPLPNPTANIALMQRTWLQIRPCGKAADP